MIGKAKLAILRLFEIGLMSPVGLCKVMVQNPPDVARFPISAIEDLSDAVLGAGLEATQLANAPVSGSLVFVKGDGIVVSSGLLNGRVALQGALSEDQVTLGLGLHIPPGSRHWISQQVETGSVGVWRPGDAHDSLYCEGSLYISATLTMDRLAQLAARLGLVLDARTLPGTGFDSRLLDPDLVRRICSLVRPLHEGRSIDPLCIKTMQSELMTALVTHLAREPRPVFWIPEHKGHAAIVSRARDFIAANLSDAISADDIAAAAGTSRSTLFRAFDVVLGEPPNSYIRKLRLNRIRNHLASERERTVTVAIAANCWGISELGRLAAWYRELFGELPSQTLARARGSCAPDAASDGPQLRRFA